MRLLFEMDKQDYENCTHSFVRNSARSIIISNKKIAMIHSEKYDYYKFPGGGIESGEDPITAMMRETREEAENYVLEFVGPQIVITRNRNVISSPYNPMMFEREARVIELLVSEGLLD